jgi:hypothetical protein
VDSLARLPTSIPQSSELITSTSTTPDPLPSSSLCRLKTPLIWQVELARGLEASKSWAWLKEVIRLKEAQRRGTFLTLTLTLTLTRNPAGDLLTRIHGAAVRTGRDLSPERVDLLLRVGVSLGVLTRTRTRTLTAAGVH